MDGIFPNLKQSGERPRGVWPSAVDYAQLLCAVEMRWATLNPSLLPMVPKSPQPRGLLDTHPASASAKTAPRWQMTFLPGSPH